MAGWVLPSCHSRFRSGFRGWNLQKECHKFPSKSQVFPRKCSLQLPFHVSTAAQRLGAPHRKRRWRRKWLRKAGGAELTSKDHGDLMDFDIFHGQKVCFLCSFWVTSWRFHDLKRSHVQLQKRMRAPLLKFPARPVGLAARDNPLDTSRKGMQVSCHSLRIIKRIKNI